jgi:capsular polysaccharide biosynthesis protein
MSDSRDRQEYEREIELIDYIEVLLKRKKLIILGTLVCVVVTGLYSMMQPRSYQAESLVVVSPAITSATDAQQQGAEGGDRPPPGMELVVPSMAAQTYEVLAKSDELMYALADTLIETLEPDLLEKLAGKEPSVPQLGYAFSEDLQVELLKETEKAKSPLLVFRYASGEERLPVIVVNWWTELFLKRNQGLSSNVTKDFYEGVLAQYEEAKKNLEDKEKELIDVDAGYHDLNFYKTEMGLKNAKLDEALKSFQQVQTDIEDKERERAHIHRLLSSLEVEEEWIGYRVLNGDTLPPGGVDSRMRRDLLRLMHTLEKMEEDSTATWQEHERDYRAFEAGVKNRLLAFERDEGIERLRAQRSQLDATLTAYRQEAASIDQGLSTARIQLAVQQRQAEQQKPVLVLAKAITDEALWNQVGRDGKVSEKEQVDLGRYHLQSEQVNPIYQELSAEINRLQVTIETYQEREGFLKEKIPKLQTQVLSLQSRLDSLEVKEAILMQKISRERMELDRRLQREKEALVSTLQRKRQAFDASRAFYLAQKEKQEQLERELVALEEEIGFYKSNYENWSGDLTGLAVQVDSLDLERRRIERDISVFQETFNRFARLQEEARIARQQAAGDIQVVSRATIARAVSRGMVIKVAIAGLVGFMGFMFLGFLIEYVQKARLGAPPPIS